MHVYTVPSPELPQIMLETLPLNANADANKNDSMELWSPRRSSVRFFFFFSPRKELPCLGRRWLLGVYDMAWILLVHRIAHVREGGNSPYKSWIIWQPFFCTSCRTFALNDFTSSLDHPKISVKGSIVKASTPSRCCRAIMAPICF